MKALKGKTSDRIRSGEIPGEALKEGRDQPDPSSKSVKGAKGQGLGKGATRGRNGGA